MITESASLEHALEQWGIWLIVSDKPGLIAHSPLSFGAQSVEETLAEEVHGHWMGLLAYRPVAAHAIRLRYVYPHRRGVDLAKELKTSPATFYNQLEMARSYLAARLGY